FCSLPHCKRSGMAVSSCRFLYALSVFPEKICEKWLTYLFPIWYNKNEKMKLGAVLPKAC
ncbi:MAG: hypothetical protein ACLT29_06380, partial [Ruminococcus callidus]